MKDHRLRCRCVTLFRASPGAVETLLPAGASPRVVRGFALLELGYARFVSSSARWLPLPHEPTFHHLSLRVALEGGDRRHVLEESTSSWLRAHLGRHASPCSRSAFDLTEPDRGMELTVRLRDRELFHLRGEPSGEPIGSVFASAQEASEFLGDGASGTELESLCVFDLRAAWIDALAIDAEFDGSFRATPVRVARVPAPAARSAEHDYGPVLPVPYLPSF